MKFALFTLMIIFSIPSFADSPTYKCEVQGYGIVFDKNQQPEQTTKLPQYYIETQEKDWRECMKLAQRLSESLKPVIVINLDGGKVTNESNNDLMFLHLEWTFDMPMRGSSDINGMVTIFTKGKDAYPVYGDRRYFPNGIKYTDVIEESK